MNAAAASTRFARVGLFLFAANTTAGVLAYALQISMGRTLSIAEYGLFAALLGIFNLIAIPLSAAVLTVTRATSRALGRGDLPRVAAIQRQAVHELGIGVAIALALAVVCSGVVAGLLQAESVSDVLLLWIAVGANAATALGLAILQGTQRFLSVGALTVANGALRLIGCLGAVVVGLGLGGVMCAFAVASLIGAALIWIRIGGPSSPRSADPTSGQLFASRQAVLLTVSNLAFVAMTQFDYVLARVFLPAEQASQYAAVSVLAKSVLWLPVGIVIALFPLVASEAAASRPSRHLLRQGLTMAAATSGLLACVLAIGSGTWVRLLYGSRFDPAAPYLAWLSLAYLPMSIVLVVDNYQLALHRAKFIGAYACVAVAEVVVLALPGPSPDRLIAVIVIGSLGCLAWAFRIVAGQVRVAEA